MARSKAHYGVSIRDLISAGILKPGDALAFEPRTGKIYTGHIEHNGDLVLDDQTFRTPSRAASTLAGNSRDGWREIKANGRSLAEYRDQLLGSKQTVPAPSVPSTAYPSAAPHLPSQPSPLRSGSLKQLILAHRDELKAEVADRMTRLSAGQFEELVAAVLAQSGYSEVRRTGGPGDRNIDVIGVYYPPFAKVAVRVQVKHRRGPPNIGPTDVAAFRDRAGGFDHVLLMVTNVDFTDGAQETASEQGRQVVHLIDGNQLISTMIDTRIGVKEGRMGMLEVDEDFWQHPSLKAGE